MYAIEKAFRDAAFATLIVELPAGETISAVDVPVGCGVGVVEEDARLACVWALDASLLAQVKIVVDRPVDYVAGVVDAIYDAVTLSPLTREEMRTALCRAWALVEALPVVRVEGN